MELRWDEAKEYPLESRYLLRRVIKTRMPVPVYSVVHSYFKSTFAANPWINFDSAMPREYAIELFVAWICDYNKEEDFEALHNIPHSAMHRVLEKMVPLTEVFAEETVKWGTIEERIETRNHFKHPIPEGLEKITLIADCTPLALKKHHLDKPTGAEGMLDYAHHTWGFKCLCFIDLQQRFRYIAEAMPAAPHDITRLREVKSEIEQNLDDEDGIATDSGVMGIEHEIQKGTWYVKKHAGRAALQEEDRIMNDKIEVVRRHVEHAFGKVKARFRLFHTKFRHAREWVTPLWRFVCGIHNLIMEYQANPTAFTTHWTGRIPQTNPPLRRSKRRKSVAERQAEEKETLPPPPLVKTPKTPSKLRRSTRKAALRSSSKQKKAATKTEPPLKRRPGRPRKEQEVKEEE